MQEEAIALQRKVNALREELAGDVFDWGNVFLECVATDKDLAPNQTAKMHAIWNSRGGKEDARKAGAGKADVSPPDLLLVFSLSSRGVQDSLYAYEEGYMQMRFSPHLLILDIQAGP